MIPEVTPNYIENVRIAPEYFEEALSDPLNPGPLTERDTLTLVTGSGSSYTMALLMSDLLRQTGRRARTIHPYELVRHQRLDDELILCISQSGETTDILDALERAENAGCPTVGVTAAPDSSLGRRVDHRITFDPASEYILSRSCGVLSCLGRLLKLHRQLTDSSEVPTGGVSRAVKRVATVTAEQLEGRRGVRIADEFVFLAGGGLGPIATESALTVQEASFLGAKAYDIKNVAHGKLFRQGPLSDIVVVLLEARDDDAAVFDAAEDALKQLGHEPIRVSSAFAQPWAAADTLAWALAHSAGLNELVGLDLSNPPHLETVQTLLDQDISPQS